MTGYGLAAAQLARVKDANLGMLCYVMLCYVLHCSAGRFRLLSMWMIMIEIEKESLI